jgi:hypothetical protein
MPIELLEENCLPRDRILHTFKKVRFYVDTEKHVQDEAFHIYLQQEPEAIRPIKEYLLRNANKYNVILTFDKDVLRLCPNAILFTLYTETWLNESDYKNIETERKKFKISTLVGGKLLTLGHEVRLFLYFSQLRFQGLPIVFFRSCAPPILPEITQNPFLEGKECSAKRGLFQDYQFHLAIENSRQENYFTEKIIDCLITKTIPIYYGCPNIADYFDTRGWILLENGTPEELVEKSRVLHYEYYNEHREVIEANYKKALYFKENFQRLNEVLKTIPGYL